MLRVDYLRTPPLPAISFRASEGTCLAVVGPSGTGKTRLLRAIADLDPASGSVFLDGASRDEMRGPEWRSLVRYVSSEPAWWSKTAREALLRQPTGTKARPDPDRLRHMLSSVGLTEDLLDQPITNLSTGQRQRMALLRALSDEPRVLLLDEPTAALDPTSSALVEELIRYQMLAGRIVLLVSHDAKLRDKLATDELDLSDLQAEPTETTPTLSGSLDEAMA